MVKTPPRPSRESKKTDPLPFRIIALVGTTLLALVLGGSTELWAQAVIVLLASVLLFLFPPRMALDREANLVFLLFFAVAMSAFLPIFLGPVPDWRSHLEDTLNAPLGSLRTPQPWLTLQACGLLLFGLVWTYHLFAQPWSLTEKTQALRLLVVGVTILATVSIVTYLSGYRIPGWNQEQNRGWFPNRNQTADVLAVCGIVTYALAFKRIQKRKLSGGLWAAALILICTALVISYSRAGILLFFSGIAVWHLGVVFRPGQAIKLAYGLSAFLVLLSLFFLFGGPTLERFLQVSETDDSLAGDYRMLIQEDALKVSLKSPVLGVGLGNFEPVFTAMRSSSADQNRTLHPESDWLWMAVEMGWTAPLLVLVGLKWWTVRCLPFALKSGESLRRAAMVATAIFILHGFVDVAGHRLGSIMVGVLLASMALSPRPKAVAQTWMPFLFRGLALVLALMGVWWLASFLANVGPPTTATLDRLQARIDEDAADGRMASISEEANAALEIAPLNWTFYFRRASAEAFRPEGTKQATNDFEIARFLEPHWVNLCQNEGEVWLAADQPALCAKAWHEALVRAGPHQTTTYATLLGLVQNNPDPVVWDSLKASASVNPDYLITFLNFATPDEEMSEINRLLYHDPVLQTLSTGQQRKLFEAWFARGDQDALAKLLLDHTELQVIGWPFLAQHFAAQKDFELASMTALRFMPPPATVPVANPKPIESMKNEFDQHPDDTVLGVMLCQSQAEANRVEDALATATTLEKAKDCPRYIYYLHAQLAVKNQAWEEAWTALRQYGGM